MIVVTVELLPHGRPEKRRLLGVMTIANRGTGSRSEGDYEGAIHAEYTDTPRRGQVLKFKRGACSVWSLVGAFLKLWGHTKHSPKLMVKEGP
jgi:hypothetical protein